MSMTTTIRLLGAALLGMAFATPTLAQGIPMHYPGQICFTPYFWCWMTQPTPGGGYVCYCPSPNGWVQGVSG